MPGPNDKPVNQAKDNLRVRHYRASDADEVHELFWQAFTVGSTSPRCLALRTNLFHPASYFAYALIFTGLAIAQSPKYRISGAILSISVAVSFFGYRRTLSNAFLRYCTRSLVDDLKDIAGHYRMKPSELNDGEFLPTGKSGFWVVEADLPSEKGREIVGCIGLDCHVRSGEPKAELRRMAVSSNYQRRGIAALLIKTLIGHAKSHNISPVYLMTPDFQEPAIRLYERHGWAEFRKIYIWDGVIKLVLIEFRLDL